MDYQGLTVEILGAQRPDLVDKIKADAGQASAQAVADAKAAGVLEGRKEGREAGKADERARLLAIDAKAAEAPGHDELVTKAKEDGETTADQLASQILAAEGAARKQHLEARKGDEAAGDKPGGDEGAGGKPGGQGGDNVSAAAARAQIEGRIAEAAKGGREISAAQAAQDVAPRNGAYYLERHGLDG